MFTVAKSTRRIITAWSMALAQYLLVLLHTVGLNTPPLYVVQAWYAGGPVETPTVIGCGSKGEPLVSTLDDDL